MTFTNPNDLAFTHHHTPWDTELAPLFKNP